MEPTAWDDELAPRSRRNPIVAVVAVLVVLSLVGGAIEIAFGRTGTKTAARPPATTSTGPPTTLGPAPSATELDKVVATISAFVARARELPFVHPVPVKLLGADEFAARVRKDSLTDLASLEKSEGVLRAVGLLAPGVKLADVLGSFLGASVVGYYDPKAKELVVRGAAITPYVRITLSHELTHALDDQHFGLDRPALDKADDESGTAFSALVEGNAVRIQEEYRKTLSAAERKQSDAEEARLSAAIDLSKVPRVIPELIEFPYQFGPALVDALVAHGGEKRVDEAFAKPPTTTEQVVDPAAWLSTGAPPVSVAPPTAEGPTFDQGVLGLWGLVLVLEDEVGQQGAISAAKGWGGDWYVAWKKGAKVCVRDTLAMDTPKDLQELGSALDDWAAAQTDAKVTRTADRVSFTSCA
ncbi:MAG: hypothetical protein QOI47_31 [Actinomycetota bacterium]|nr:hypothetical protein [Actinomycetota bacterium]